MHSYLTNCIRNGALYFMSQVNIGEKITIRI